MAEKVAGGGKTVIIIIAVAIIGLLLYGFLTMPDKRSTGDKIGDAVDTFENGGSLSDSARQLEDRTPGEKIGDAVKDAGDEIKESTDR